MEVAQAFQFVDSTMRADSALMSAATGGVWQGKADIGVIAPFASFAHQAGSEVLTFNAVRLWSSLLMQVVAIGPTNSYAALVTIANRIDALFGRAGPVALSQGGVLSCYREQTLAIDEPLVNGQAWSRLGGLYRIALQGS